MQRVVVSGYGFGDKNVNTLLGSWLQDGGNKRAVVIHPDRSTMLREARPAMGGIKEPENEQRGILERAEAAGTLAILSHRFESASWTEMADALGLVDQ